MQTKKTVRDCKARIRNTANVLQRDEQSNRELFILRKVHKYLERPRYQGCLAASGKRVQNKMLCVATFHLSQNKTALVRRHTEHSSSALRRAESSYSQPARRSGDDCQVELLRVDC